MRLPTLTLPPIPKDVSPELKVWIEQLLTYLQDFNQKAKEILFNDSEEIEYTTNATANTEDEIQHHLNRVPLGYILLKTKNGGIVYDGDTAWTKQKMYLKCTTANNKVKILVF